MTVRDRKIFQLERISGVDIFFFHRLKVVKYNEGRAKLLMSQLIKILDGRQLSAFNSVNPYGPMSMNDLVLFYKRYGFELRFGENGMFRTPQLNHFFQ
jgi:hypothetical protein